MTHKKGAPADDDSLGGIPLHYAPEQSYKDIVDYLVSRGTYINAETNNGKTPLWLARKKGYTVIVELLKKHGAK